MLTGTGLKPGACEHVCVHTENWSSGAHIRTRLKLRARECVQPDWSPGVLTGTGLILGAQECRHNQTENQLSGAHTNHIEQGAREHAWEPGVAGGVRSTKDRDMPALEVRAGTLAVGCTSWDAAGFLVAPTETELKLPRELSGERTAISLF